jgi:cholesterol transport system auxiliary component
MLYSQGNYRLSAFAENTWVAPPAAMIAPLLMQTLQQSAYFKAVLLEPVTAKATYQLNVRLVSLYQDFNVNPSTVKLVVEVSLSTQNGRVLAGTRFNVAVPASANTPEAGVAATNAAVAQVLQDINGFVLQAVKLSSSS